MARLRERQWQIYWEDSSSPDTSLPAAGIQRGEVGAVGEGLGHDAGLGAHVGASHVADLAIGAAAVAVGEAQGVRGRHRRGGHDKGDEEEGNHNHLGLRHGPCEKVGIGSGEIEEQGRGGEDC